MIRITNTNEIESPSGGGVLSFKLEKAAKESLTFEKILEMEPEVRRLYNVAKMIGDNKKNRTFCASVVWYQLFEPVLVELVGWERKAKDILATSVAYDLAYKSIYKALPNCRGCLCG